MRGDSTSAIRAERDLVTARRPRGVAVRGRVVGQVHGIGAVRVHHVHFAVAVAATFEGDLLPVRRPRREEVVGRVERQPRLPRTVGVHDVDRLVAIAIRHERDVPVIRRPHRHLLGGEVVRELGLPRPIGVHHVDLAAQVRGAARREGDATSIVRPVGPRVVAGDRGELGRLRAGRLHHEHLETGAIAIAGEGEQLTGEHRVVDRRRGDQRGVEGARTGARIGTADGERDAKQRDGCDLEGAHGHSFIPSFCTGSSLPRSSLHHCAKRRAS